jgi:surface protein
MTTLVPINFVIPEFESTIRLNQDVLSEMETSSSPETSFICDVNIDRGLFCDTFLFSTNDVNNWSSSGNLEKTMFIVNNSMDFNVSTPLWNWKSYSTGVHMFNLATSIVSDNTLHVFDFTTKLNVNVTEIYCAWYMSTILNGMKDVQVLVKNANIIQTEINNLFLNYIWNTSFDNILWYYNYTVPSSGSYTSIHPTANTNYIKFNSRYPNLTLLPDNPNCYGIPFVTNNTPENQTLPQRLFEQMAYNDMQRIPTLCASNHITLTDCYPDNNSSLISNKIITNTLSSSINTNVYKFPFISGDTFVFKLNLKVKTDNTLTIFNGGSGGNITQNLSTLNEAFNLGEDEGTSYLSYLIRMTLIDIVPVLEGTFIFSFSLNSQPSSIYYKDSNYINENINVPIPINANNGELKYTSVVSITDNTFLVTVSYKVYSEESVSGLTFKSNNNYVVNFFNNYTTNLTIVQFGNIPLENNGFQFSTLNSLTFSPTANAPTLYPGTSLYGCFMSCPTFNSEISSWNTSNITSMGNMFNGATIFNKPIGNWDTSNVTNMSSMFQSATKFNQTIGDWNTSKVTNMRTMFFGATDFDQPIGNWNTSNVTSMHGMFESASKFNQPIGTWNVTNNTTCFRMFSKASLFNQSLVNWNTINVTNMDEMFNVAVNFNGDIGNWNTSNVTTMKTMFQSATLFNKPIGNWNTSKVTTMDSMFRNANSFNQPIGTWDTSNVINMAFMFSTTVSPFSSFNQPIGTWDTSKVANMQSMFLQANVFNQSISNWNVSNVGIMQSMFQFATAFNNGGDSGISNWNAPKCSNFTNMFYNAPVFNQPLTNLLSGLTVNTTTSNMFALAYNFNQNLNNWNMSKTTSIQGMFKSTSITVDKQCTFNNGELGYTNISGSASIASYVSSTKTLTCGNALFLTELVIGDIILIRTATQLFPTPIASIIDQTNLVIEYTYPSNLLAGSILSIDKQVSGTTPLTWSLDLCSNANSAFQNCVYFNQNISQTATKWKMNLVTDIVLMFQSGSSSSRHLFNNGEIITGTTAPLNWIFNAAPISTNWRQNCVLNNSNNVANYTLP